MKRIIGITGGVGAGKSQVLSIIRDCYGGEVLVADEIAHQLMLPGQACYHDLLKLFGEDILAADGKIDKDRMSRLIFQDGEKRIQVNEIVHPRVKEEILKRIQASPKELVAVEAALLIESGYEDVYQELWYIHASPEVRRKRLWRSRGYSAEKSNAIMASQLSEEQFRRHCQVVIDNSGTVEALKVQLREYLPECRSLRPDSH